MHKRILMLIGALAGLSIPLVFYLFKFNGHLSDNHTTWAEFGSYVSGVYGTFAFLILAYTTDLTRKQFKIQNEDNVFFKLYESLQSRITNITAIVDDKEHAAHQVLKILANKFYEELSWQTLEIARMLLCRDPENIANVHYMKLFMAMYGENAVNSFSEDKANFIADITSQPDFNSRWERLKDRIGSRGYESDSVKDALRATGSVNFYKIPFSERRQYYKIVAQRLSSEYGEFLDGYFKNICFLVGFAAKAHNRTVYIDFIKSQLTKYELVIIFYLIAGRSDQLGVMKNFYDLGIVDGLLTPECGSLMLDCPSPKELEAELYNVFNDEGW